MPAKDSMRTEAGLYVTSVEAHQMITHPEGREVVLIDVRDSIEIKFTGYTQMTDIHVPWKIIDSNNWDDKKQSYGGQRNDNFSNEVQTQLDKMGVSKDVHLLPISSLIKAMPTYIPWSMVLRAEQRKMVNAKDLGLLVDGKILNCHGAGNWKKMSCMGLTKKL